jgi:DNA-binding winged helix-turn-helix (wHTH) protein
MSEAPLKKARDLLPRPSDLSALFGDVRKMHCVSVVGISNLGKSALLRSMTDSATQVTYLGDERASYLFVYVDFNQMLEMTEQAFYELILRCSIDVLRQIDGAVEREVLQKVESSYAGLVAPASSFEVPLRFAQAMTAIGNRLPQKAVFLFDEVDGPVAGIDGRVFLNLRALKDRHQTSLTYVTATNRRLGQIRQDPDVAEFSERFAHHTWYISPLSPDEVSVYVRSFVTSSNVTFSDADSAFIRNWAGGHPSLLETTCLVLGELTGRPVRDSSQDWIIHRRAAELLTMDVNIHAECRKIWADLSAAEQDVLFAVHQGNEVSQSQDLESVVAKHLAVGRGSERRLFARAFDEFVRRQHLAQRTVRSGLELDPEGGEVWVDGRKVPSLTNLEYRLLLLLYGRMGKICTKYDVVEAVWGEDYIDEVDDARIEKLISRLRQKIEPDAANPRWVLTVRGRGYKLAEA